MTKFGELDIMIMIYLLWKRVQRNTYVQNDKYFCSASYSNDYFFFRPATELPHDQHWGVCTKLPNHPEPMMISTTGLMRIRDMPEDH